MAVRLKSNGTYEFDTVEEAVRFQEISVGGELAHVPAPNLEGFMSQLPSDWHSIILALNAEDGEPLTTKELAAAVGANVGTIGPRIRQIRERATKKYGLGGEDVIVTERVPGPLGVPMSRYRIGNALRKSPQT